MLYICHNLRELDFSALTAVYEEGLRRRARRNMSSGIWEETQELFWYLQEDFFCLPGAVYMIWEDAGIYRSALRLRPYRDGLLMDGLETAPGDRRRGYAGELLRQSLIWAGERPVYSHVDKRNRASLCLHAACGFHLLEDHAVLLDGTLTRDCLTLRYWNKIG